jgi:hypothetical protein
MKYRNRLALIAEKKAVKPCEDCGTTKKGVDSIRCKACADIRADESKRMAALKYEFPEWYAKHEARVKTAERMIRR